MKLRKKAVSSLYEAYGDRYLKIGQEIEDSSPIVTHSSLPGTIIISLWEESSLQKKKRLLN